jgi:hypothetical protein
MDASQTIDSTIPWRAKKHQSCAESGGPNKSPQNVKHEFMKVDRDTTDGSSAGDQFMSPDKGVLLANSQLCIGSASMIGSGKPVSSVKSVVQTFSRQPMYQRLPRHFSTT